MNIKKQIIDHISIAIKNSLIVILGMLILCSCSVKSKNSLISYAKNQYGSCKFVREEVTGQGNNETRTVYLIDKETGIEYTVSSSLIAMSIDGSTFGYSESTSSDFMDLYIDMVLNNAKKDIDSLKDEYGFENDGIYKILFSSRTSGNTAKEASSKLFDIIKKYDTKDLLYPDFLVFSENEEIYIGLYESRTGNWSGNDSYKVIDHVRSVLPDAEFTFSIYGIPESYVDYDDYEKLRARGIKEDNNFSTEFFFFKDPKYGTIVAFDLEPLDLDGFVISKYLDYGPGKTLECEELGIRL